MVEDIFVAVYVDNILHAFLPWFLIFTILQGSVLMVQLQHYEIISKLTK